MLLIFLVRDKEGITHQIRNENSPAYIKGNYTSGQSAEDDKVATITIECTHPAIIYEESIPLKAVSIDTSS